MSQLVMYPNKKQSHKISKKWVSSLKLFNKKMDLSKKKICIGGIKNVKTPYRRRFYFHAHPKVNPYNPLSKGYSRLSQLINIFPSVLKYLKYPLPLRKNEIQNEIQKEIKKEIKKEIQPIIAIEETKINAKQITYYNKPNNKSVEENILGLDIDACIYLFLIA